MRAAESPSSDLVPLSYDRNFMNNLNGWSLEHHSDCLTADQAEAINSTFDIEIHLGRHGLNVDPSEPDYYTRFVDKAPTQEEYAAVTDVVMSLLPTDTLFIEGVGFTESVSPVEYMPPGMRKNLHQFLIDDHRMSLWEHAQALAHIMGLQVVNADIDIIEAKAIQAIYKRPLDEIYYSSEPDDWGIMQQISRRREKRSWSIIKDWALEHVDDPLYAAVDSDRKPKLAVFFGNRHAPGFKALVKTSGINANIFQLPVTTPSARDRELSEFLVKRMIEQSNALRGQNLPPMPPAAMFQPGKLTFPDTRL